MLAMLLQSANPLLILSSILDEVLDVWGLPFAFLELPCDIHTPGCMPRFEVVLEHEVLIVGRGVVQCANELIPCHVLLFSRFIIILINGRTQFGTLIRYWIKRH